MKCPSKVSGCLLKELFADFSLLNSSIGHYIGSNEEVPAFEPRIPLEIALQLCALHIFSGPSL